MPDIMYFGPHPCKVLDMWSDRSVSFILGQSQINVKYYALINEHTILEFDLRPSRELVTVVWMSSRERLKLA